MPTRTRRGRLAAPTPRTLAAVALVTLTTGWQLAVAVPASAGSGPQVLRVGSYRGIPGQYRTIQAAVDEARAGDWILVGPGDYRTPEDSGWGVYVTTPRIHIRGMDRNEVIVDGTRPPSAGAAPEPCPREKAKQAFGPEEDGAPQGRNGIEVFQVDGVSVENLTVCNFLSSADGENGNQVWFNGGDGTGLIGMGSYTGRYLTTTSTFGNEPGSALAKYGLFASNASGPGLFDHSYAGNMADGAFYIGACPDCNAVIDHSHAENSALGFSGTNAGGHLIIQRSVFDRNRTGVVPNSLNNDDAPPPQNGHCPGHETGPTGTVSCTIIRNNTIRRNNNPNVPSSGIAGQAAIGAGIEVAGGQYDTIVGNHITRQGGWGVVVHDFPDQETPPPVSHCEGGTQVSPDVCLFQSFGNETASNTFKGNGFFGNPGNVDLANDSQAHDPGNCFHGNTDPAGLTSDPPDIETVNGTCGEPNQGDTSLTAQLLCASGIEGECPAGSTYPQRTGVNMVPMKPRPTMPDPCGGVPKNRWCRHTSVGPAQAPSAGVAAIAARPLGRVPDRP